MSHRVIFRDKNDGFGSQSSVIQTDYFFTINLMVYFDQMYIVKKIKIFFLLCTTKGTQKITEI